jgi:hypothetical protein
MHDASRVKANTNTRTGMGTYLLSTGANARTGTDTDTDPRAVAYHMPRTVKRTHSDATRPHRGAEDSVQRSGFCAGTCIGFWVREHTRNEARSKENAGA